MSIIESSNEAVEDMNEESEEIRENLKNPFIVIIIIGFSHILPINIISTIPLFYNLHIILVLSPSK